MSRIRPPVAEPEYYFRDDFGKTFYASFSKIYEAVLDLNININNTAYGCGAACLNDFYALLDQTPTAKGSLLVWDSMCMWEDWDTNTVDIWFEEKYIGGELTYLLHYVIAPCTDYLHPNDRD